MPNDITPYLETFSRNADCWYASVRPDGRPHIAPIWFVWVDNAAWLVTKASAVRAQNLAASDLASIAGPDTKSPFIMEGRSEHVAEVPEAVSDAFFEKYEWKLGTDDPEYTFVIRFAPVKVLAWDTSAEGSLRWRNHGGQWQESDK
jgi:hypothetical protein